MASANFQCPNCKESKSVIFTPGNLTKIVCEKCNIEMKRVWKNVSMVKVVDDNVVEAGQTLLRAGMATKDKLVF